MSVITKEKLEATFDFVATIAEAVREAREIPSATLYSMILEKVDLQQFEQILGILKRAELIKVKNHLIVWVGPEIIVDNTTTLTGV